MTHPDPKDELVTHLRDLRAFAVSLTRNRTMADDLVQDTILKAWSNLDKFKPGTRMKAWLFTILRNTYYTQHQKRKREIEDPGGIHLDTRSVKPDHDGRLHLRDFQTAFNQLNDEQREALILVGAEGFSYDEAAEMVGAAPGTVKSRVNRARARLTELMGLDKDGAMDLTDKATRAIVTDEY